MRLATKNEILILLGECAPAFAAFCVSDPGATTRFLFDNTSNFDLDSDLVQTMVGGLNQAGIIDEAAVERLAGFGVVPPPAAPAKEYAYYIPDGYPTPTGVIRSITTVDLPGKIIVVYIEITDGIAQEVTL